MLLETWASALQASGPSQALRASMWLYPLVNTGHVAGIALLFGAIAPLDLRLIGCWKSVPLAPLARVLVPVSIAGFVLAASTGSLLFLARPLDYIHEPLFGTKMALLCAAVLNALILRRSPQWKLVRADAGGIPRPAWRISALASIVLWLGVITLGRLIGYR
ncbi:MAG: hypothetical protein IV094_05110 [Vitreoscilla sp.]|nr:hypothetical protein [Vitreoscilla sp.]